MIVTVMVAMHASDANYAFGMSLATKTEMPAFLSKNDVLSLIVCPIGHFP